MSMPVNNETNNNDFIFCCVAIKRIAVAEVLLQHGNCIPMALYHLTGECNRPAIITYISNMSDHLNAEAVERGTRSYRDTAALLGEQIAPVAFAVLQVGDYLLHTEHKGRPHCISVRVPDDNTMCSCFIGKHVAECSKEDLQKLMETSADFSTMRLFKRYAAGTESWL
jgi:hypothetical protein